MDIRKVITELIQGENTELNKVTQKTDPPRVLLIDEVDVFFSKEFYGEIYGP